MSKIKAPQFGNSELMKFRIDGSAVTTSDGVNTGLISGQHLATIKKGSGADSNLITLTLLSPLGMPPDVLIQEVTLDCVAREETAPTKQVIQIRTLELDGVTKEDDADLIVLLVGTRNIREGRYS